MSNNPLAATAIVVVVVAVVALVGWLDRDKRR